MNKSFAETYFSFDQVDWLAMKQSFYDTLYMTIVSTILVIVLGLLLGLVLYSLGRKKKASSKFSYTVVSIISNIFRSTPFMILMVLLIPFTTMLVGTMLGAKAAIPALVLSAVPFYARQVVYKVLIPESIPALISGITVTTITMIGYTAMAGTIGAGGLGSLAWQEGFQRGNYTVTMVATVIILVIVFIVQAIGDTLTKQTDKR